MKKHVFLILAHKNIHLLNNLINTLSLFNGDVVIHLDAKSGINYKEVFKDEINLGKVSFVKNNIKVYWGGYSTIRATFLLIDYALKNFRNNGHYHLLSEQCFPVKSADYFTKYFEQNEETNYIEAYELPHFKWGERGRLERMEHYHIYDYFNVNSKKLTDVSVRYLNSFMKHSQRLLLFKRKYSHKLPKLYGGSQWWSLTYECINWLNEYYKRNQALQTRFLYTRLSDEIFIQTIFMNSPFVKENHKNYNLRYIRWRKGSHPQLLNTQDHWGFIQNENVLFARKLNPDDDSFAKKINEEIILSSKEEYG